MNNNVTRLSLPDDVAALVEQSDPMDAFAVLTMASEKQADEQEMTLDDALTAIRAVSALVEAIG